jgi:hypothetical protein
VQPLAIRGRDRCVWRWHSYIVLYSSVIKVSLFLSLFLRTATLHKLPNNYGFKIHSSLAFRGVRFQELLRRTKIHQQFTPPPPPKIDVSVFFKCLSFLCRNIVMIAASFIPSAPSTSCGMTRRLVRVIEQFWCSNPLKGASDVSSLLRRHCEFAKPRRTHPRVYR